MNKFEYKFFIKYIPEWWCIKDIVHIHIINIFSQIFIYLSLVLIPSFLYFYSQRIQGLIEFYYLEIFIIIIFIKIIYEIFNWYNDVLIVLDKWIVILKWSIFDDNIQAIEFDKIEALEANQSWLIDQIFSKWDLIIHKFWDVNITIKSITNPNWAIDKIKNVMDNDLEKKEKSKNEKFDIIMDSLSSVVEDFLRKKENETIIKTNKEEEILNNAKKYSKTIDLR